MNKLIILFFIHLFTREIICLFNSKHILCDEIIEQSTIDTSLKTHQNISIQLCNLTFSLSLHPNEHLFSQNVSIEKNFQVKEKQRFSHVGHVIDEERSSVTVVNYPKLQIYIYLNGTYYYYLSLPKNTSIVLKFSQRQLLQYYPLLVNDSLWTSLQNEEEIYQKNSMILHDLHFIYEILTLRCESDHVQYRTVSFCSLALYIDRFLYKKLFGSNVFWIYNHIEHFNFLLRTLTRNEYGGFQIKRLVSINHEEINSNNSLDMLHQISNNISLPLKDYCLNHHMFLSQVENDTHVLGYQSSIHTYDIGGICSSPFYINNNNSEEINLNTGLSIFPDNHLENLTIFFNGLMKTSYLYFRQMGLNLTLCSINGTRRGFFQFNSPVSPVVQHCIDLVPNTLRPALKRRAHLCFTHLNFNLNNHSNQPIKQQITCQQSIDLRSSVPDSDKNQKTPYIENAINDNRRGEWFEGNIVGMILTLSLLIWIPVSCFVHFCIDEINKNTIIEKQQQLQKELEPLSIKTPTIQSNDLNKETQTD